MSEHAVFVLDAVGTWVVATGADLPENILSGLSKLFCANNAFTVQICNFKIAGRGRGTWVLRWDGILRAITQVKTIEKKWLGLGCWCSRQSYRNFTLNALGSFE